MRPNPNYSSYCDSFALPLQVCGSKARTVWIRNHLSCWIQKHTWYADLVPSSEWDSAQEPHVSA